MVKFKERKYIHTDCNLSMLTDEHDRRELKFSFKSHSFSISSREKALFCGNTKCCVPNREVVTGGTVKEIKQKQSSQMKLKQHGVKKKII